MEENTTVPAKAKNAEDNALVTEGRRQSKKSPITFMETDGEVKCFANNPSQEPQRVCGKDYQQALQQVTGIEGKEIAYSLVTITASTLPDNLSMAERFNLVVQGLSDLEPMDSVEAGFISHIIALHSKAMVFLISSDPQKANTAVKLFRVYNETVEALCRYRRKGEQRFLVQHVQVNDGGKAIVGGGNVMAGGGGSP